MMPAAFFLYLVVHVAPDLTPWPPLPQREGESESSRWSQRHQPQQ